MGYFGLLQPQLTRSGSTLRTMKPVKYLEDDEASKYLEDNKTRKYLEDDEASEDDDEETEEFGRYRTGGDLSRRVHLHWCCQGFSA